MSRRHLAFLLALAAAPLASGCGEAAPDDPAASSASASSTQEYRRFHDVLGTAKKAHEALSTSEALRASLTARVTVALSPEEQRAFRAAFAAGPGREPAEAYVAAVRALADVMLAPASGDSPREINPWVLEAARPNEWWPTSTGGSASQDVYEAMKLLADVPDTSAAALTFAGHVLARTTFEYARGGRGSYEDIAGKATSEGSGTTKLASRVYEDIANGALLNRALFVMSRTFVADTKAAPSPTLWRDILGPIAELERKMGGVYDTTTPFGGAIADALVASPGELRAKLDAVTALAPAAASPLQTMVLQALVIGNFFQAQKHWAEENYLATFSDVLRSLPPGVVLSTTALSIAGRSFDAAARAGEIVGGSARFLPALMLASTILQTARAFGDFERRGDDASRVILAGDVVALGGFGASTAVALGLAPTGFGTPAAVLILTGTALQFIGAWLFSQAEEARDNGILRDLLGKVGIEVDLAATLVAAKPERMSELGSPQGMGLTPAQVKAIARRHPALVTNDSHHGWAIYGLVDLTRAYASNAAFDPVVFLDRIAASGPDSDFQLFAFCNDIGQTRLSSYPNPRAAGDLSLQKQWVQALRGAMAAFASDGAKDIGSAFRTAVDYLDPIAR